MSAAAVGIVRVRLLAAAGKALLGAPPRVYQLAAPPNVVRPYLIYGRIHGEPEYHYTGEGGLSRMAAQIDGYADTAAALVALDDLLRLNLSGFRGDVTVDGTLYSVRRCHFRAEHEGVVSPQGGANLPIFHLSKEVEIDVSQTIPSY